MCSLGLNMSTKLGLSSPVSEGVGFGHLKGFSDSQRSIIHSLHHKIHFTPAASAGVKDSEVHLRTKGTDRHQLSCTNSSSFSQLMPIDRKQGEA